MDNVVGRSVTGIAPAVQQTRGQVQVGNMDRGFVIRTKIAFAFTGRLLVRVVVLIELNGLQLFAALVGCRRARIEDDRGLALMETVEDAIRPCEMGSVHRPGACMEDR